MSLKFQFPLITFSLVNGFTFAKVKGIWFGRVCIVLRNIHCVEKLGEKYKNLALMWNPHFPLGSIQTTRVTFLLKHLRTTFNDTQN